MSLKSSQINHLILWPHGLLEVIKLKGVLVCLSLVPILERVSPCSLGSPKTQNSPISSSKVFELEVCTTMLCLKG